MSLVFVLVFLPLVVVLARDVARGLRAPSAPALEGFEEQELVRDGLRRRRRLVGTRRGRQVELLVSGGDQLERMWFASPFPWVLPREGLELKVRGMGPCSVREGWLRGLGTNPLGLGEDLGVGLPALVFEGAFEAGLRLDGERVVMVFAAPQLQHQRAVEQALDVVEALEEALLGPWRRAAREHRLSLGGPDEQGLPTLRGIAHGVEVEVSVQSGRTRILASFRSQLPMDLALRAGSGGVALGDPVLDMLLCAQTARPERCGALTAEGMPELLLPVLHAFPDSELRWDRVVLRAPGQLREELPEAVTAVLTLARALLH